MIGKNIKKFFRPLQNEEGSVIVVVLFILVIKKVYAIGVISDDQSGVRNQFLAGTRGHQIEMSAASIRKKQVLYFRTE